MTVVLARFIKGEEEEKDFKLEDQYIAMFKDNWTVYQLKSLGKEVAKFKINNSESIPLFFKFGEKLMDKAILKATLDPKFDKDSDEVTDIDAGADIFCFSYGPYYVNIYAYEKGSRII